MGRDEYEQPFPCLRCIKRPAVGGLLPLAGAGVGMEPADTQIAMLTELVRHAPADRHGDPAERPCVGGSSFHVTTVDTAGDAVKRQFWPGASHLGDGNPGAVPLRPAVM